MLAQIIRAEIARTGPIPFRRFMELALYHPEHGFYASGRARVGRSGDFFTNVSVGPLFGKLLARQFAEMWERLECPAHFTIVEQGAHDGQFAADALTSLREDLPQCFAATRYEIVEPSAKLAAAQRARLRNLPVRWRSAISELPAFTGVHFSNELLDAFPVHLIKWNGESWTEHHVTIDGERFTFADGPLSESELADACARIPQPLPPGYVTEVSLAAGAWLREVAAKLQRGYILAVDYGHLREDYYSTERVEGTLSAYAQHRRERDPLERVGEVDLTAHVEFTSLMEAGRAAGLGVAGYTDQHHFMVGLGASYFESGAQPSELRAFQTLMHPSLMGLAFKVIGFAKGPIPGGLAGFRYARAVPE